MQALLYFGALVLAFVALLTVLVILMQRPSANAGMGAALGGGAAESAFGGEAGNVLTKTTNVFIIIFLVLSLGLFLGFKATKNGGQKASVLEKLQSTTPVAPAAPTISPAPAATKPADTSKPAAAKTPVTAPTTTAPATAPAATPAK